MVERLVGFDEITPQQKRRSNRHGPGYAGEKEKAGNSRGGSRGSIRVFKIGGRGGGRADLGELIRRRRVLGEVLACFGMILPPAVGCLGSELKVDPVHVAMGIFELGLNGIQHEFMDAGHGNINRERIHVDL